MEKRRLWRYHAGSKAVNRVVIYERRPGGILQVDWWDADGRHQRSLRKLTGHPITAQTKDSRKLARQIADKMAAEQLRHRQALLDQSLNRGPKLEKTVGDLLKAMHANRAPEWSARYAYEQERYRKWWTAKLGEDKRLASITDTLVTEIVRRAGKKWTDATKRHYYRYLVDAFTWGAKRRWLDWNPLTPLEMPKGKSKGKAYTRDELARLWPKLKEVDSRAYAVALTAYWTGRRLNAIRTLPRGAADFAADPPHVAFPAETDKVRQSGVAVVPEAVRTALKACAGKDWLFPSDSGSGPVPVKELYRFLREAEERARVGHLPQRGFHALKRAFATDSKGLAGRDKQAGTQDATMDRIYVQDDLRHKLELVRQLEERRR